VKKKKKRGGNKGDRVVGGVLRKISGSEDSYAVTVLDKSKVWGSEEIKR
jgi:hypothetical protein